ncbi:beta-1,6-N-acetylglucosaminyltransferase [Eikenella sp. Marseille-P7795]|uniref:beta-1,6-N-acetylglucosaminyltransferase n=1 Tax=Eikenella sp. Marseille-P7795 TaxID=2866577 RepID=UPI001CE41EE0|nr:beta-1,6-N-acetylglucosaminyltransferase [Eikenella sp. Marseille-P7795]
MSSAFLILCHRPPLYWLRLAERHPEIRLLLHYDAKADIGALPPLPPNAQLIPQRVDIRWAGFSMVQATLHLMRAALAEEGIRFVHLASGNCVLLKPPAQIEREFAELPLGSLLLECRPAPRLRYRVRFNTPHADTAWQRSLPGKLLTKVFQVADKILPAAQTAYAGSQWFSADRAALQTLLHAADEPTCAFFRKKLCPDEHFFQYLVKRLPENERSEFRPNAGLTLFPHNRRYIRFAPGSNHPDILALPELHALQNGQNWLARKVADDTALRFLAETEEGAA